MRVGIWTLVSRPFVPPQGRGSCLRSLSSSGATLAIGVVLAAPAIPAIAQPLTGGVRQNFVDSGVTTCGAAARKSIAGNEAFLTKAGYQLDKIDDYCRCKMEYLADIITPDDFADLSAGRQPASLAATSADADKKCMPILKPPAP